MLEVYLGGSCAAGRYRS